MTTISKFVLAAGLGLAMLATISEAQIPYFGGIHSDDFDILVSTGQGTFDTVPVGWSFVETGMNANVFYTAGTGSSSSGDTYSFGSPFIHERAFGQVRTGLVIVILGFNIQNFTGATIDQIDISYIGEQWRLGASGRGNDKMDFQYSLDATSLTTGTWIDYDPLDFTAPNSTGLVGPLDGNAPANRTSISGNITGLTWANGSQMWIRWIDVDAISSDDGLAIDDFSFTNAAPLQLTVAVSRKTHGGAGDFDINLLNFNSGPECRSSGGAHTLVFTFSNNVVSGNAAVTSGIGSVAGSPGFAGNTMTVNLTGVIDVQKITVTLSGVTDTFANVLPDTAMSVNMLIGDTNGNRFVNAGDVAQTKSTSGQTTDATNFRNDVNATGSINAGDVAQVKANSGHSLP